MASKLKVKTKKTDRIVFDIVATENGYEITYAYGDSPNRKYTKTIYDTASYMKIYAFIGQKLLGIEQPKRRV